jgi:hypothetical protein
MDSRQPVPGSSCPPAPELPATSPGALRQLAAAQVAAVRRHVRTGLAGLAGAVLLAGVLTAALRDPRFVAAHPGSITLDGSLVALLLVLAGWAASQALLALRAGRLATRGPAPVPCSVHRLNADTRMRRDYLLLRREGTNGAAVSVLVRCDREAGLTQLPERCAGSLVAVGRFGPVIIGTPDLPPIIGHAGRYERLLPRNLRADWVRAAVAGRHRAETD